MFLHRRPAAKQGVLAALSTAMVHGFPSTDREGPKPSDHPVGQLQAIILALHEQHDMYGRDLLKRVRNVNNHRLAVLYSRTMHRKPW